jgi:hypothetical protein
VPEYGDIFCDSASRRDKTLVVRVSWESRTLFLKMARKFGGDRAELFEHMVRTMFLELLRRGEKF